MSKNRNLYSVSLYYRAGHHTMCILHVVFKFLSIPISDLMLLISCESPSASLLNNNIHSILILDDDDVSTSSTYLSERRAVGSSRRLKLVWLSFPFPINTNIPWVVAHSLKLRVCVSVLHSNLDIMNLYIVNFMI